MFTIDSSNPFPPTMLRAKSRLATLTASELEELRVLQAAAARAAIEQVRHAAATRIQAAWRGCRCRLARSPKMSDLDLDCECCNRRRQCHSGQKNQCHEVHVLVQKLSFM